MTTFTIERKKPLPPRRNEPKYRDVLTKLNVGDSFFVKGKTQSGVSSAIAPWKLKLNIELTCRTENGGVRVWRTK